MRKVYKFVALMLQIFFLISAENRRDYKILVEAEVLKAKYVESTKTVTVITSKDLKSLPFSSLSGLLSSLFSLTVLRRGPESFDVGIRGSSPKRVLILVNGIRINDPQTEHFNMEIPISLKDIDRIEIIKGGTSTFYGSGAFAGVINIITKARGKVYVDFTGGEKGFYSAGFKAAPGYFTLGLSSRRSDGYYPGQEFEVKKVNVGFSKGKISLFGGISWKKLGERNFYAPYPSYEEIESFLLTGKYSSGNLEVSFLSRKLKDHFILDRTRPKWYENFHDNYLNTVKTTYSLSFKNFSLMVGGEGYLESLTSQRLGNHLRKSGALFLLARKATLRTLFESGIRIELFTVYRPFAGFYAGLEQDLGGSMYLTISAGNSIRRPTFTELYYESPANIGDPRLAPEKSLNLEAGLKGKAGKLDASVSLYFRRERDVIDWVRNSSGEPWRAKNLPDVNFLGVEFNLGWRGNGFLAGIGGMRNSISHSIDVETKYALAFEKIKLSGMLGINRGRMSLYSVVSYKEMYRGEGGFFLDSRFSISVGRARFYIQGNNLFNTVIEEIPGIKIPGRWFFVGVSMEN